MSIGEFLKNAIALGVPQWKRDVSGNILGLVEPSGKMVNPVGLRATPVRIATFGDSTANLGATSSPDTQDTSFITAPFPASGVTYIGVPPQKFMASLFYSQAYLVANCGVSGETTTQMLARDGAVYSTLRKAITDLLNIGVDAVLYRGGSINDLSSVNSGNWQSTADAVFLRQQQIISRLIDGGAQVILCQGIYGYGDGGGAIGSDPVSVRLALKYLNGLLSTYCQQHSNKLYYLDPVTAGIQSIDGKFVVGTTNDGVHLNYAGQYLAAKIEAAALRSIFGASVGARYKGLNLVSNPMFENTGAVAQGVAATGVTFSSVNANGANAKVEMIDGRQWQTVEWTLTGTGNSESILMTLPIASAGILAGDVFGIEYDFFVQPLSGLSTIIPTSFFGRVDILKTGQGRLIAINDFGDTPISGVAGIVGKMQFPPLKIQESSALIAHNSFTLSLSTNHASGVIKMGVSQPRMVKLGKAVLTS